MNMLGQGLITTAFIMWLSGCGGSERTELLQPSLKVPSPVVDYVLDTVYTDTLLKVTPEDLPAFVVSTRFGQEQAISFSHARNVRVSRITWIGKVAGNADLTGAKFVLRFYDHSMDLPAESPVVEHLVTARAELLHSDDTGSVYQFVYSDYAMFFMGAGNYWVSILDAEVDDVSITLAALDNGEGVTLSASSQRYFGGEWSRDSRFLSVKIEGGPPVE